jgi:hypothetical protein
MTLDEVIDQLECQDETVVLWLLPIALEVKEQRQEIAKLRVLLEHEETVRSKKLHRETPVKSQSFLRGNTLHKGDRMRVTAEKATGTIDQVDGNRVKLVFVACEGGEYARWYKRTELERVASVA